MRVAYDASTTGGLCRWKPSFLCLQCFPFASYNEIPIFGDTVVAVVGFVCRLGLGNSRGVFKD